jgi:TM2 domain-containing membrane protein YozV
MTETTTPRPATATTSDKNTLAALLLCIFLGTLGVHRFFVGKIGTGFAMIGVTVVTLGAGGVVWTIIDIIAIARSKFQDKEGRTLVWS